MSRKLSQQNLARTKKRKRKKRSYKKITISLFMFMFFAAGFFVLMNRPYFFVQKINLAGFETVSEKDFSEFTENYLDQKAWWFIPRKNVFFTNTNKLEQKLQTQFPRIAELYIKIQDGNTMEIDITERDARLLWCVDIEYDSVFDEECYFTDHSGIFYTKAPYFSDRVFLKLFVAPEVAELAVNTSFYNEEQISDFLDFVEYLHSEYSISIRRAQIDRFGDVHLVLNRLHDTVFIHSQPLLIYNQDQSYEQILRNIGLTLRHDSFVDNFEKSAQRFEKIDVRFDGRLIYKFKTGV